MTDPAHSSGRHAAHLASRSRKRGAGGRHLLPGALLAVAFLAGVALLLYPTVSDLWNRHVQSSVVVSYAEAVDAMDEETRAALLADARAYNEELASTEEFRWELTDEQLARYEALLDAEGTGVMAYIEIPSIDVTLPVYHGTSEAVLQVGVGHLEGSSLPVGGRGTHTVISGHRGLPSARLFTDIDRLDEGDLFYIHVLGNTLAYEVDQILTVEPTELDALEIDPASDLCTLVTCTPYGINSHRLLVRGHRVELAADEDQTVSEPPAADQTIWYVAGGAVAVLACAVAGGALWRRHHARRERQARRLRP